MGDVLETLFSILPVAIAVIWILRRLGRKAGGGRTATEKGGQAGSQEEGRPTGIRSNRLRDERREKSRKQKAERKSALEKVLARVAEFTEGVQQQGHPPGEDELYDRIDHSWPGSTAASKPVHQAASGESHSILVDLDEEESDPTPAVGDSSHEPGTLDRISRLSPLAQGIIWSEILGTPAGLKGSEEDYS